MPIGLVGTGNMGTRIGGKLLAAGKELFVFDRLPSACDALCALGAARAESLAALAQSADTVITLLPDDRVVRAVALEGPESLVARLPAGATIIDMSTSTPWLAAEIDAAATKRGVFYADAPLIKGGELIVVGATADTFERSRAILTLLTDHLFHVGGAGMGQTMKLVRQYVAFSYFMAEMEGLMTARKAGLDIVQAAKILEMSVGFRAHGWDAAFHGNFGEPGRASATLQLIAKDIELAVSLARRVRSPATTGVNLLDILSRGMAQDLGQYNFWAAIKVIEQMAGAELRRNSP